MKFLSSFRREKHSPTVYSSFCLVDWDTFPKDDSKISDGFPNQLESERERIPWTFRKSAEEFDTHFQRTIDSGLWRPG